VTSERARDLSYPRCSKSASCDSGFSPMRSVQDFFSNPLLLTWRLSFLITKINEDAALPPRANSECRLIDSPPSLFTFFVLRHQYSCRSMATNRYRIEVSFIAEFGLLSFFSFLLLISDFFVSRRPLSLLFLRLSSSLFYQKEER